MQSLQRGDQQIDDLADCCNVHHLHAQQCLLESPALMLCYTTYWGISVVMKFSCFITGGQTSSPQSTSTPSLKIMLCYSTHGMLTVGKVSLELCALLTSSFGCTDLSPSLPPMISIALFAITCSSSFAMPVTEQP